MVIFTSEMRISERVHKVCKNLSLTLRASVGVDISDWVKGTCKLQTDPRTAGLYSEHEDQNPIQLRCM